MITRKTLLRHIADSYHESMALGVEPITLYIHPRRWEWTQGLLLAQGIADHKRDIHDWPARGYRQYNGDILPPKLTDPQAEAQIINPLIERFGVPKGWWFAEIRRATGEMTIIFQLANDYTKRYQCQKTADYLALRHARAAAYPVTQTLIMPIISDKHGEAI